MISSTLRTTLIIALAFALFGCASAPVIETSICSVARAEVTKCGDSTSDTCTYYRLLVGYCDRDQTLLAGAPTTAPGSGYTPTNLQTSYRAIPGGPELHSIGSLSFDPWAVNCAGKVEGEYAACLRSRFLTQSPEVCNAYAHAFGVDSCGTPAGGWTRGPSNERWGSAKSALDYFCLNDPAFIGSTGRAGGWDCDSTALDWARLGAFGGEGVVTEWVKRTSTPPPPPPPPTPCAPCPICPPEVRCDSCCPDPLPCPPPFVPQLTARTLGELKVVCSQIPPLRAQQRKRCVEAIKELGEKLGFEVSGGVGVDPLGERRAGGSIIDPCGDRIAGGSGIDPVGRSGATGIDPIGKRSSMQYVCFPAFPTHPEVRVANCNWVKVALSAERW